MPSARSLRTRLLRLATLAIGIGMAIVWLALVTIFERHLERIAAAELSNEVVRLAAALDASGEGLALTDALFDPRFERPFGGRYWQIDAEGAESLRSRSLWDETLPPPAGGEDSLTYKAAGPLGRLLLLHAETLAFARADGGERAVRAIVAVDHAEISAAVASFGRDLAVGLLVVCAFLVAGAAFQVRVGLSPLDSLRDGLARVRAGEIGRLDANVPSEVAPLVEEVNDLLAAQDAALARARAQADDLAHGLKTPLTVLSAVSHNLGREGRDDDASEIVGQVEMMRRRIDRQLARARLANDHISASRPAVLVDKLIGVMERTPQGARLAWRHETREESAVAADDVDVAEAIGNILDNACKWARSEVRVMTERRDGALVVRIEDDGPGVPEDRLGLIMGRGARLDAEVEGCGLGLAIARDIVAAYGGEIRLGRSALGGLLAEIAWPAVTGGVRGAG